jgi:hypothetical protein
MSTIWTDFGLPLMLMPMPMPNQERKERRKWQRQNNFKLPGSEREKEREREREQKRKRKVNRWPYFHKRVSRALQVRLTARRRGRRRRRRRRPYMYLDLYLKRDANYRARWVLRGQSFTICGITTRVICLIPLTMWASIAEMPELKSNMNYF